MNMKSETSNAGGRGEDSYQHMVPQLDDLLTPEEMDQVGDMGGEGDDIESPEVARLASLPLSPRQFFLLHRMDQAIKQFKAALRAKRLRIEESEERVPEEVWRRLGDEALGIEPYAHEHELAVREADLARKIDEARRQLDRVRKAAQALALLADELAPSRNPEARHPC